MKGKPLRFISLKDTSPDDLEGSQLQVALHGVVQNTGLEPGSLSSTLLLPFITSCVTFGDLLNLAGPQL